MKQEINGQGVHTDVVNLNEVQIGDTIVLPTRGELKNEKKIFPLGWEPLVTLNREAAEIEFMREFPNSIMNEKGSSPNGKSPEKMAEWEIGFGVVLQTSLVLPHQEQVVVLCRASKYEYVILRSRETRYSDRFS